MTMPFATRRSAGLDPSAADPDVTGWTQNLARVILAHALLVGVAADALLRQGPSGVAFPLWIAVGVLATTSVVWRSGRPVMAEARAWLATALLFALGVVWRDGGMLQLLDLVATGGALIMAGVALNNARAALFAERLRDTLWAGAMIVRNVAVGMLPLTLRDLGAPDLAGRATSRVRPLVRAGAIAAALLLVFGALLRDADPIFASLVALPDIDVGLVVSHLVVIGFFTWTAGGWARGAVLAEPSHRAPDALPFRLGMLDITSVLGALNALFLLFVLSQLGWFFGGEAFLRERTGLTAAAYAREGFFQMVWVVALVVPLLLVTRAALEPGRAVARRHTVLALPVIALLLAIIVSAFLRMQLYVHYFGLTSERFYPLVCMAWLGVVLLWLAATVLRDWGQPFVAGAVVSGAVMLGALNVIAPDAIVARVNADRAADAPATSLDRAYLASLGGEAADIAVAATLAPVRGAPNTPLRYADEAARCRAAETLLRRWGPSSANRARDDDAGAWRRWNAGDQHGRDAVTRNVTALRAVAHASCRSPSAAGGAPRAQR